MKIKYFFDQGSAKIPEDGMICRHPYHFAVFDGVSGVYTPDKGPIMFGGRTGGQLAVDSACRAFYGASPEHTLEDILLRANTVLRGKIEKYLLGAFTETAFLPATTFVVSEITDEKVTIIQGGDSSAVWQMKNGTLGGTSNKMYAYEEELLSIIAELMEECGGNRQKMWEKFRPILIRKRQACVNTEQGRFAILNGQLGFERFWQKHILPKKEITTLILFTDGLVPFERTKNELELAQYVFPLYEKGGLQGVLRETRRIAEQNRTSSHENYAEATALVIKF